MKVVLADDDREITELLRYVFQREGYNVVTTGDGIGHGILFKLNRLTS